MMATERIKPGVYFTAIQGEGVVMDLLTDRYLGITAEGARVWQAFAGGAALGEIAGDLARDGASEHPAASRRVADYVDAWREAGLLAAGSASSPVLPRGKEAGRPAAGAVDEAGVAGARPSVAALYHLVRASVGTRRALRRGGLPEALRRLQSIPARPLDATALDTVLARTVRAYRLLRVPFRQGAADCLARSLTLAAALRRQGVDAELCLGVRKFPFLAHAWVEAAGRMVNEVPAAARACVVIGRF